ncbi:hypothetical protein MCC01989_12540 [Bifidobacteriaceae bacterium MCC01989]|nr:hypothetical protein MCC01989_12540 [Bifidobacteriaceae bacterium MCC01989]
MGESAYAPMEPARRPAGHPQDRPSYRVLVHRKYADKWSQIVGRVGADAANRFWDHVSSNPGGTPETATSCILKGKAGEPKKDGFSRMIHYELSSMARINYQYSDDYQTLPGGDKHRVVFIWTIDYSSH